MLKKLIFLLMTLVVAMTAPAGAVFADSGSSQQGQVIFQQAICGSYMIWQDPGGQWETTSQEVDNPGTKPGDHATMFYDYTVPDSILQNYTITGVTVTNQITEDLYNACVNDGGGHFGLGLDAHTIVGFDGFEYYFVERSPANYSVKAVLPQYDKGRVSIVTDLTLEPIGQAYNLLDYDTRELLGLTNNDYLRTALQGYEWMTPAVITWYGVPKQQQGQLVVTPPSATVQVGGTQQYTATYYPNGQANGNGQDVTNQCTWTVQDGSIASISSNTGLATGNNAGTTQVTATYNVPNSTLTLQGNASLTVQGNQAPPPVNDTSVNGLHFQAISQVSAITGKPDTGGNVRAPDTAKWTDTVTATLTPLHIQNIVTEGSSPDYTTTVAPPPPPSGGCEPNYTSIDSWSLNSATLTYPKQNPHYTFGDPRPPVGVQPDIPGVPIPLSTWADGTLTANMTPTSDGHSLTCKFKEMWAENGTYLHDILNPSLDSWIQSPQTYILTASNIQVTVNYTVHTFHLVCSQDGCTCVQDISPGSYTYTLNPISGNLLVNGTGVAW